MSKEQPRITPREAAKRLIRPYVLRSDPLEHLQGSYLGTHCDLYSAAIGGSVVEGDADSLDDPSPIRTLRHTTGKQIAVSAVNGRTVNHVFPLKELYEEIKREADLRTPKQTTLFPESEGIA